jgi:hypothetical protein
MIQPGRILEIASKVACIPPHRFMTIAETRARTYLDPQIGDDSCEARKHVVEELMGKRIDTGQPDAPNPRHARSRAHPKHLARILGHLIYDAEDRPG